MRIKQKEEKVKRAVLKGEIYMIDLGLNKGSEVNKIRPCIILQNNIGNKYSPTTIIAPISHRNARKKLLPTQIELKDDMVLGEKIDGVILLEQIRTVDKGRITSDNSIGFILPEAMEKIRDALFISLDL